MTASINDSGAAGHPARKPYAKPRVTRIALDARCAVLGYCKTAGTGGPVYTGCETITEDPCSAAGS